MAIRVKCRMRAIRLTATLTQRISTEMRSATVAVTLVKKSGNYFCAFAASTIALRVGMSFNGGAVLLKVRI